MTIQITDDNVLEDDEEFQLELSVPEDEPITLLEPNHVAAVHILNDDGKIMQCTNYSQMISYNNVASFKFLFNTSHWHQLDNISGRSQSCTRQMSISSSGKFLKIACSDSGAF